MAVKVCYVEILFKASNYHNTHKYVREPRVYVKLYLKQKIIFFSNTMFLQIERFYNSRCLKVMDSEVSRLFKLFQLQPNTFYFIFLNKIILSNVFIHKLILFTFFKYFFNFKILTKVSKVLFYSKM